MDEPTSGISSEIEDKLFSLLRHKQITYITVAHGSNLKKVSFNGCKALKTKKNN